MQTPGFAHLLQLAAQSAHALADHPSVSLDLGFTRPAEEAKATALTLQVSPAAHKPTLLVIKMRQLNLQSPFGSGGSFPENLENQPGPVDHLAGELFFQIALLDRAERAIHHDQFCTVLFAGYADIFDLPCPEQQVRPHFAHGQHKAILDLYPYGERKTLGLAQTVLRIKIIGHAPNVGAYNQCFCAARYLAQQIIIETQ